MTEATKTDINDSMFLGEAVLNKPVKTPPQESMGSPTWQERKQKWDAIHEKVTAHIGDRDGALIERPSELWELTAGEARQLVQAEEFAIAASEDFQRQFWETVERSSEDKASTYDRIIRHIKEKNWDKPRFKILRAADARDLAQEHNLRRGRFIREESMIIVVELPKPMQHFRWKGELSNQERRETGYDGNTDNVDIGGTAFEWGKTYQLCQQQLWYSIYDIGYEKDLYFDRINPKGNHVPEEYYYIFEMLEEESWDRQVADAEKMLSFAEIALAGDETERKLGELMLRTREFWKLVELDEELGRYQARKYNYLDSFEYFREEKGLRKDTQSYEYDVWGVIPIEVAGLYEEDDWLEAVIGNKNPEVIIIADPLESEPIEVVSIEVDTSSLPQLPKGYGYSGGVARTELLRVLGEKRISPPRDLDVVAIAEGNPNVMYADKIGKILMPDDYKHGYGVSGEYEGGELVAGEALGKYMTTRDFVMNEALIMDGRAYFTVQALRDLRNKVIRPTKMEQTGWFHSFEEERGVQSKLVMKALRLQVEFEEMYGRGSIEGIPDWQWSFENITPFFIALQLEKAMQRGDLIAQRFFEKLKEKGTVVEELPDEETYVEALVASSLEDLGINISMYMEENGGRPFEFTSPMLNSGMTDEEMYDALAEEYASRVRNLPSRARGV